MPEQTQGTQDPPKRTWTKHTFPCRGCGELCRASQEAIDTNRSSGHGAGDADIAASIDICLECLTGEAVPGEKVHRKITGLTDDEVLAIQAGMEVADDKQEPVTGYWSALGKVSKVAQQVLRERGHPNGGLRVPDAVIMIRAVVAAPDPSEPKTEVVALGAGLVTGADTMTLETSEGRRYRVVVDDGSLVLERLS